MIDHIEECPRCRRSALEHDPARHEWRCLWCGHAELDAEHEKRVAVQPGGYTVSAGAGSCFADDVRISVRGQPLEPGTDFVVRDGQLEVTESGSRKMGWRPHLVIVNQEHETDGLTEQGRRLREALADLRLEVERSVPGRFMRWICESLTKILRRWSR